MKPKPKPRIVVRVIRNRENRRSGVWKVAYADFVTAMMAFFLLMWLISSSTEKDLEEIARYFSMPLSAALSGGKSDSDRSIVVDGGDMDLTRTGGHVEKSAPDLATAERELKRQEAERLSRLKADLEKAIDSSPSMRKFRNQLLIDITANGLRIQIVDERNRPMFDLGSAELQPYAVEILHAIGKMLNAVPNKISLSGHTDAAPYPGKAKEYNNWDLSIDRANASRRALVEGGMPENKVLRVIGLSSAIPFDRQDPLDPINRRISIIVMKEQAARAVDRN